MPTVRLCEDLAEHETAVRRLLSAADESFVPPLSSSDRAEVSRPGDEEGPTDIDGYVERCLDRPMIGAFETHTDQVNGDDEGRLIGFLSFDEVTESDALGEYTPTNHVEVLVVEAAARNAGVATRLYAHLLSALPPALERPHVSTKTWSTNDAHLAILERLSFRCVHRVADDRTPGIDTVYYARKARK